MISTRDAFLQQQEIDSQEESSEHFFNEDMLEQQHAETLPVIDMNKLAPSDQNMSIQVSEDKNELINYTSVDIANGIINSILDGKVNALDFAVRKKLLIDSLEMAAKNPDVKKMCISEVEKYGKGGAVLLGAKVTITGRRQYQYSEDPTWKSLKKSIAKTEEQIKEQEKKIQAAVKNNCSMVDSDTGELIASVVPAPESTSIAVSFSKKK
jgi:hypothetical protein